MIETKFKQGELCAIPTDWAEGRFCDFLQTFSSGATPYRGNPRNYIGSIPWISSGELNYNVITDTLEHISENAQKQTNLKLHKPGTFLMAITGLEAAGTRGKCAFVGVPATTNQSCMAINGTDKMDTSYLYWFYRFWSETLAFKFCQGTKQQSYTAAIVKSLPIYTPDNIVEQQRIASALTSVDNLLSSLDKLIAKKRDIKQGAMQQLLTGKTRLKGFTEPWGKYDVKDLGIFMKGHGISKAQAQSGDIPAVRYGELYTVHNNYIKTFQSCISQEVANEAVILQKGDILFACSGETKEEIGKCAAYIDDFQAYVGGDIIILRTDNAKYSALFLGFILNTPSVARQKAGKGQGDAIVHISKDALASITIHLPSLREQQAIAIALKSIDDEIAALEAKRKKYEAVKQGMMQQLLTGKIRLINQ
jgi:type I restriction enzyme S subunit